MSISQTASTAPERPRASRAKQLAVLQLVRYPPRPNGAAAATALAAGAGLVLLGGALALGIASRDVVGLVLAAWLALWLGLHLALRRRVLRLGRTMLLAVALAAIGATGCALALINGISAR
ncbi:hypothetical protein [Kouleothrix sp.]|uniref:hypothetical protein n=1 Tax=Kouleothrix sp. TaxID=2779161 RepID=UPI00391A7F88